MRYQLAATALATALCLSGTPATAMDCSTGYTIRSGDSLGKIARLCGSTVKAIVAANDRIANPSQISVGWTISIPSADGTVSASKRKAAEPGETAELTGRIVNGRWCAHLETEDGQTWGIVSNEHLLRSGTSATVRGHTIKKSRCNTQQTLLVTELSN